MKYERGKIYYIRVKISMLDGGIFILSPMWGQSPEYVWTEFRPYVFLGENGHGVHFFQQLRRNKGRSRPVITFTKPDMCQLEAEKLIRKGGKR